MVKDLFDVEGKVVVITGGLGRLGWQFSMSLVERGAKVVIFDIRKNELWKELLKANSGTDITRNIYIITTDITKQESIETALGKVMENWDVPHALINAAAIDSPPGSLVFWDEVMNVNVKGTSLCCQIVGKEMGKAGRGSIINISSIYGLVSPDQRIYHDFIKPVAYCASKSAVLNLTRYYATLFAERNVRVNTLTPGGVFNNQDRLFVENYCQRTPLGRMANADEYNGAIIFLISDASSYMTGSNLIIDGGWTAW